MVVVVGALLEFVSLLSTPTFLVGALRTMCGSRTGGWSLPCVMSD
jgi:hypothetical protein